METIIEKFLEIAIILIAAKFGAELMRRINQPAVIGELVIGIIIGYYGLGLLPHFESGDVVSTLAEIGVVLLLFEVGLETNLDEFIELGSTSLLVALIGVVAPFALGFGSIYALATLLSSFTLIWIGKKIDDLELIYYSYLVIFLLFFSSIFFFTFIMPFFLPFT